MRKFLLASCLAVACGGFAAVSGPARAIDNDDVSPSDTGCGSSIFCGWWHWTIQGPGGGVGSAGTCYAGDYACIPPGATNPGQPGDPCFQNPYSDGCGGGSANWSASPSQTGPAGGGGNGGRNRLR